MRLFSSEPVEEEEAARERKGGSASDGVRLRAWGARAGGDASGACDRAARHGAERFSAAGSRRWGEARRGDVPPVVELARGKGDGANGAQLDAIKGARDCAGRGRGS